MIEGLVSVIIPTYKRSEMLPRAIKSVCSQTYKNLEVIVVSDNDPDDEYTATAKKIVESFQDERIKYIIQEKHINGAVARNKGIKVAKGEYIAFLDDDDYWMPTKIEEQVKALKQLDDSWGGVSCKIKWVDANDKVVGKSYKYEDGYIYKDIIYMYTNVATGTLLLRRNALDDAGYFDENLLRSQDIQLLTNFTYKYKLKEVDQYLHCADCSDGQNRLIDENKYLNVCKAYFESVRPILETMTSAEKKCAQNMRYLTLGYILLKQGEFFKGLKYGIRVLAHPLSLKFAVKVVKRKIKERTQ